MRNARVFSLLVFAVLMAYGAAGFYGLPLATFQGDLTRMGQVPETLFGWTKPQPSIKPELIKQASMREADAFVIGDSFSKTLVWQTVLTQHGFKVRTDTWDNIQAVCADIVPWLLAQGFSGKHLVVEIIERDLEKRLGDSLSCTKTQYRHRTNLDVPIPPPISLFDPKQGDYSSKLSVAIHTLWNILKYEFLGRSSDFKTWTIHKDVKLERISNGCELFSHSKCSDSLFLTWDKENDINRNAIDTLRKLNDRIEGITPVWVFVPNRSTAYLYPKKQFWGDIEHDFLAPNLLRMTQEAIQKKTIDLYPANNTHFSTSGYLMMGEEVLKTIRKSKP